MARKKKTIVEIYDKDLGTVTTKDMKGKVLAVSHAANEASARKKKPELTKAGEEYMDRMKKHKVSGLETLMRGNWAEAEASCSLDGCTQSCPACVQKVEHVCGQRPMTVAERELVEAALRHDMLAVMDAEKKVYAERKEAAK